jgi:uncharacterized protein (DUF1800 family)
MAATDILGTADAAHLLRRAGFGATAKDLAGFAKRTRAEAVELLLGTKTRRSRPPAGAGGELALAKMQRWWLKQMQSPSWRLHEKVALFWHAHFATPWSAVPNPAQLARQNGVFRELGLGAFRTLLYEVTRDAAMLEFRDGARSGPADPNENYARALLEQYALGARDLAGMPNYVEADVVAYARGLTGFQLGPKDLAGQVDLEFFDDGMKQVFVGNAAEAVGVLGVEDGSGNQLPAVQNLLDVLFAHRDSEDRPTLARFIARKLWEWFAYPEPELVLVDALADEFVASGYRTGALVEALLLRDEFYGEAARSSTPRTPVDFALASLRALGAKSSLAALPGALARMGMALFDPPAVDGWNRGEEWLTTGLMQRRLEFAQALAAGRSSKAYTLAPNKLFDLKSSDAAALVDALLATLDVAPSAVSRQVLVDYVAGGAGLDPKERVERTLRGAVALALSLPEYQVH